MMEGLTRELIAFRDARNWAHYHTPENLAKSISIEAAELLEVYQWGDGYKARKEATDEIADIAIYLLTLCHELNIDLEQAIIQKVEKNEGKYPS